MLVIYIKKYYNYSLYKWKKELLELDSCTRKDNGWLVIYFLCIIDLYGI